MTCKFTKGYWAFNKGCCAIGVKDTTDTQSYGMLNLIARIDNFDYPEDWEANGRLISAAPNLYNALKLCLDSLSGEFKLPDDVVLESRAALNKADGR